MRTKSILKFEDVLTDFNNGMGIEKLALKYHVGKLKIKTLLLENGVEMKKRGGQKQNNTYVVSDWKIEKYPSEEGYHYIARFREDGKEFNDYMNQAGSLTSYIKEKIGIDTPSLYDRRKYYMETGNYWWEQWFDIVKVENKPTKKCPYCNWETTDNENRSGAFEVHLREKHNMSIEEYISNMPHEIDYFPVYKKSLEKKTKLNDEHYYIVCPICGEHLEKMTLWHLKSRHNISLTEFKRQFPDFKMLSDNMYEQASEAFKEANLHVSKNKFISKYEKELREWLKDKGVIFESTRQFLIGKEIDIIIPDKKIGIEFNGLKWHTEWFGKKNRQYHIDKTIKCNEKGYGLIHIFEDEYVNKKDIVYSKISHILGLDADLQKIYARKCLIKEIYKHEADVFLDKNHIQGSVSATVYIGAFYNQELIGVMLFKKGNLKNKSWELVRFATDNNKICCGLGSKMFAFFNKTYKPTCVISFADRRWTMNINENLYTKMGFNLDKCSAPDYRYYNEYVNKFQRFHKMRFNKKTLSKKYGFPLTMTETEMVKELGYDRIWDCGLIKYIWKKPEE